MTERVFRFSQDPLRESWMSTFAFEDPEIHQNDPTCKSIIFTRELINFTTIK